MVELELPSLSKQARYEALPQGMGGFKKSFLDELLSSGEVLFASKISWLIMLGPVALIGEYFEIGEFAAFLLAAGALIPCAERLSFVTEQVALHTNMAFGALLNATFGNAPELLISTAALRAGYYRVVQLTLLGSILTNLLLVFGMACFIGGLKWKVQHVKLTSGNVSVGMLFIATAGLVLPAALKISNQTIFTADGIVNAEIKYSRVNATIMVSLYLAYLFFQLHTHKEEFDDDHDFSDDLKPHGTNTEMTSPDRKMQNTGAANDDAVEIRSKHLSSQTNNDNCENDENGTKLPQSVPLHYPEKETEMRRVNTGNVKRFDQNISESNPSLSFAFVNVAANGESVPSAEGSMDDGIELARLLRPHAHLKAHSSDGVIDSEDMISLQEDKALISFRTGIVWLMIITLCVSAMSNILVDTIDGFAKRCNIGEVFTALIILPIFSNIAEAFSSILFAHRNKMDLCVGITVGSAVQISLFVLPACVLIGWAMDRSMSLFFHGFETCCLVMGVLSVSTVLHGGTTNWLAGLFFIGVYLIIAAGFWFHEVENLTTDEEFLVYNDTQ